MSSGHLTPVTDPVAGLKSRHDHFCKKEFRLLARRAIVSSDGYDQPRIRAARVTVVPASPNRSGRMTISKDLLAERVIATARRWEHDLSMRFNLITQPLMSSNGAATSIPLSLTLRPSRGAPGEYTYSTDSSSLLRLLEARTDLSSEVIRRFMRDVFTSAKARLLGVELNDEVLQVIGFFVD
ncbi:hypothetical protein HDF16_005491 [Granulicella aggregans]|uniref:Uncharacterized protein n=1 Tax=Granulicella aggregans TaxID=474949 RepID=A0A7W8E7Y0_9BACT|nr:hypothetical protein [Granulicella aggregans]MBB5060755.1 hypothetical protein [Granulicella aggregans]